MIEDALKICMKRRYESEREADKMILYLTQTRHVEGTLRSYSCHICHNWHLTSKG